MSISDNLRTMIKRLEDVTGAKVEPERFGWHMHPDTERELRRELGIPDGRVQLMELHGIPIHVCSKAPLGKIILAQLPQNMTDEGDNL